MPNHEGAVFVCVRPGKAVELKDGFAQRVTPEASLRELLGTNADLHPREEFATRTFEHAAFGIVPPKDKESAGPNAAHPLFYTHAEGDQCVAVVGRLDNAQALREAHFPESGELNDAVLIGKLYRKMQDEKHKYAFVSQLEGEFAFALYNATYDSCLAGRDSSGKYMLLQGVDKKTGGLVVTNTRFTNGHQMTEIPAGMFIFGKYRDRHLHPIHKDAANAAEERFHATPRRRSASLYVPPAAAASEAVSRAMAGLKEVLSTPSCSAATPVKVQGRSTPSAKGTADKQVTWRRSCDEEHLARPRATTTSSAKGTADKADSWRSAAAPEVSVWNPVVLPDLLSNGQTSYDPEADRHPLDYAVEGMHTELLTQALDEFMGSSSSPRSSKSFDKRMYSESASFTRDSIEDLLSLSKLSGKPLQVNQKKAVKQTTMAVKKEKITSKDQQLNSNCSVKSSKRFTSRIG